MFWFIIIAVTGLAILITRLIINKYTPGKSREYSNCRTDAYNTLVVCFGSWCALTVVYLIIAIAVTASYTYMANDVNNSYFYLQEATAQREAILVQFDDVLSNEDFVQLMNAAVPEDVKFLKNNPEVTGFLLGRADRIVEINAKLFEIRNKILKDAKDICNTVDSPLIPQLPLFTPDCRLGEIIKLTDPTTVNVDE